MEEPLMASTGTQGLQPRKRGLVPGLDPHHSLSRGWEATGPTSSTCREQKSQEMCLVLQGKMTETGVNPQGIWHKWQQLPGYSCFLRWSGCSPVPQFPQLPSTRTIS